jgi:hypothetical protein
MSFNDWSTTAASNASIGGIIWAEGQLPSTVNNSARAQMADVADIRDGNVVATGWHVKANGLTIRDQSDTTKKVIFDVSSVSAGSTRTIGFQNVAGTVALVGPYFQAHLSAAQSLTTNETAKINFDTEDFDSNSNYDNATNFRFTPTVAGKYRVKAHILCGGTYNVNQGVVAYIKKNGSTYVAMGISYSNGSQPPNTAVVEAIVSFNGSTDYVETWVLSSGVTPTVTASNLSANSEIDSYFMAEFIGP